MRTDRTTDSSAVRRRATSAAALSALALGPLLVTSPAAAVPEPWAESPIAVRAVFDEDLTGVLFINTSRAAFCTPDMVQFESDLTEWLEDPVGAEPAFPGDPDGLVTFEGQRDEVRPGVVVGTLTGSALPAEVWAFDPGIVDQGTLGVGPCLDTDQASTVLATGSGRWRLGDNDLFGSGTRGNAWGDSIHVDLDGPGGSWSYSATFRNRTTPAGAYRFAGGERVVAHG